LNFLISKRTIPRINLLVDIYNLISIKYGLALGAHDLSKIDGNVTLRLTRGDEIFFPLGQSDPKLIPKGDYSYIDDSNEIICHLEVRQVEKTKITLNTSDAFFIVQGNENTSDDYLNLATQDLINLIKENCGGKERFILSL
jgi:DNA/RNA-binding domain of Phe-tRNA-synthetase-like protein